MSSPSSSTSPASCADGTSSCIRLRIRRNVDLPQPDGPISAVMPPAGMVRETRSRTLWSPNHAVMSFARSSASGAAGTGGRVVVSSIAALMSFVPRRALVMWWCGYDVRRPDPSGPTHVGGLLLLDREALAGARDLVVAGVDGLQGVLPLRQLQRELGDAVLQL